jgi:molybdopterin converting factor small subunit
MDLTGGLLARALGEGGTLPVAVNQALARPETSVHERDEVRLFPPVACG